MKVTFITWIILAFMQTGFSQTFKKTQLLPGEVSLSFFDSDVYFSISHDEEKIIALHFEEDEAESNPVSGVFNLSNHLTDSLEINNVIFNDKRINEIIQIFISPNFDVATGGLVIIDIYYDDSWGNYLFFDLVRRSDGTFSYLYVDPSSKKRMRPDWIDIRLNFKLKIKKIYLERNRKQVLIFPNN